MSCLEPPASTYSWVYSYTRKLYHACTPIQVLLNILADEIHRAHQKCLTDMSCDPNQKKLDFVVEAGRKTMRLIQGAYSCLCLVKNVGLVAFRDPFGIR